MVSFKSSISYLVILFLFACGFSNNQEKELAKSLSFIPHEEPVTSNIIVSLSLYEYKSDAKINLNSQIWFSPNLYIKGGISPGKFDSNISSAFRMGLGYAPQFPWSANSSSAIEFGMFQVKWFGEKNYKWFYGMLSQSFNYKNSDIRISWTHLSDPDWYHEQFSIVFSRGINETFGAHFQTILYRSGNRIKLNPVITITTAL